MRTVEYDGHKATDRQLAADRLREGELIAFPTETVYGLGADATNVAAVARIYEAKGRPASNPLIVHVATIDQARPLVTSWPLHAERLAMAFWPGPLTIVLPAADCIARNVLAGGTTVGLRVPNHSIAIDFIAKAERPVAAPSANLSNRVSPTSPEVVMEQLGGRIHGILTGGLCEVGIESTVIEVTEAGWRMLRPGMISKEQLSAIAPTMGEQGSPPSAVLKSPGQLSKHYSPVLPTRMLLVDEALGKDCFVIFCGKKKGEASDYLELPSEPAAYAQKLYQALWKADHSGCREIVIEPVPDDAPWDALRDRLRRACGS